MAWYVNYTSVTLLKAKRRHFQEKKKNVWERGFKKKKKLYLKWESLQKSRN